MISDTDKKMVKQYYEKYLNGELNGLKITVQLNESDEILQKDFLENNFISPIENQGLPFLKDLYNHKFPFSGPTEMESIQKELVECFINGILGDVDEKECDGLLKRRAN